MLMDILQISDTLANTLDTMNICKINANHCVQMCQCVASISGGATPGCLLELFITLDYVRYIT